MKNIRTGLSLFSMVAFVLIASSFAQAQNTRSFVSAKTGLDTNACTYAAPCRTFAGALTKTNIQGEIDVLDPGDYGDGTTLAINKSVTIDGGGIAYLTGGNGLAVPANAVSIGTTSVFDVVTLRGLSLHGAHLGGVPSAFFNGINASLSNGALVLEHVQIGNFSGGGVNFQPASGALFVRDCEFTNNERFGITIKATVGAVFSIDNVRLTNNGVFGTGIGITVQDNTQGTISDSVIAYNGLQGIQASPAVGTSEVNVESSVIVGNSNNLQAGFAGPGAATIRMSNVDVFDATVSALSWTGGSEIRSFGNNRIAGNFGTNGPPTGLVIPQQ